MEFAPAGVPVAFEVTFDRNDLVVGMTVYDVSASSPVVAQATTLMALVAYNTYSAKFTPQNGKNYVAIKAVYTSETFMTLDPDYPQGSESLVAEFLTGASGCSVTGYVINDTTIVGYVEC